MRRATIASLSSFALIFAFMASPAAQSQSDPLHPKLVPGYQDEHGIFYPFNHEDPDVATPPTAGKITVTFEITVKSTLPAGSKVFCAVSLVASSTSATNPLTDLSYFETGANLATGTGATRTCIVPINYSWKFPLANKNVLAGSYTVVAVDPAIPALGTSSAAAVRGESAAIPGLSAVPSTPTTAITITATL